VSNAHLLYVVRGICSWPYAADRRCLWLSTLDTGRQRSATYPGVVLTLVHLNAQLDLVSNVKPVIMSYFYCSEMMDTAKYYVWFVEL